ncbi:hypothetical protein NHX12_001332 [Muraenolepis orangiensis]|uniref:Uncharacterized protein n=1 Tax=Muraenolepis orangiensis TaxID=630683 RepID=A0A9Q0E2V1_9TELE|nr:hypothetical protein NHX12_001332 [Muraenolepis orangiensis]
MASSRWDYRDQGGEQGAVPTDSAWISQAGGQYYVFQEELAISLKLRQSRAHRAMDGNRTPLPGEDVWRSTEKSSPTDYPEEPEEKEEEPEEEPEEHTGVTRGVTTGNM